MEEFKDYPTASASDVNATPQLRERHVPDVPEDVDFLMEHLNDPNFDLGGFPSPAATSSSVEFDRQSHERHAKSSAYGSEYDNESQLDSTHYSSHATRTGSPYTEGALEYEDESPYPEVRAAVSSVDDPLMPVNTFRMWFLGVITSILLSGLNQFFSMRYPSVLITGVVAQLIVLPIGKGLERILPTTRFNTFGYTWSLNPGPFNIKEHVCITVMANVVANGAYSTDIVATQQVFFNQSVPYSYNILLALSTQIIGFSFSGFLRQYIVWPSSMIWPGALVNSALFNTLHRNYGKPDRKHISREKFFCIALACSFIWYWIPGFLFTALSVFNWVCWAAPNNVAVNVLFGTNTGLGMGLLTFDWSMISYIGSPLVTPWWSEANTAAALVIFFFIVAPAMYFTNTYYAKFMPVSATVLFDNTGMPYDVSQIVTNGTFDVAKYEAYSPVFLTTTLVLAYGLAFAAFASIVVHTFIWFRRDIARRFNTSLQDERDVHSRLMQAYPEVPRWWYAGLGLIAFIMLVVTVEVFPTDMPIWACIIALLIAAGISLPLGILHAITNQQIALQVMFEMLCGYMLPGRPIAVMIFKALTYIGSNQAVSFCGDLKLGHYMKVPPRMMFMCQVVAAVLSCFTVTLVQNWMFANITDFCSPTQADGFICPSTTTFATAAVIWGGVGPGRLFSVGQRYDAILYFFLVGAILPVPLYFLARRYPLSIWRYINVPVFFAGVGAMPPASGINFSSWAVVGFIFNFWIRRYRLRWWMRYNYILSAALDAGVAISMVVIFFTVQLPRGGVVLNWWGNNFWTTTADAQGIPMLIPDNASGTFGPTTW